MFLFSDCKGIIENVVLLGAPVEGDARNWKPFPRVVSGKIINGYCRSVPSPGSDLALWCAGHKASMFCGGPLIPVLRGTEPRGLPEAPES